MDKRNFPHSKQLCPLLELLRCYPLSLHNIKEAGKGNRGPYDACGRLVYNKLFRASWRGLRATHQGLGASQGAMDKWTSHTSYPITLFGWRITHLLPQGPPSEA